MALLNRTVCLTAGSNTGFGDCVLIPKNIVGMFIVPKNFVLTPANQLTLKTALQDAALENNIVDRIFPIHNFAAITDNSAEAPTETLGYGGISVLNDGDYNWLFRIGLGGLCLNKALRKFNNKVSRVLLYDAGGILYGVKSGDNMVGIPVKLFYAHKFTIADGSSTTTAFNLQLVLEPRYLNDDIAFLDAGNDGFMLSEIEGIKDVALTETATSAKPILSVLASVGCSGDNLYDQYADELAVAAAWVVLNTVTGATITPTSVAKNAGLKAFTITIPTTAVPVSVSLASVSALEALGVVGYESKPLITA